MSVPIDTYSWLRALDPPLDRYAGVLSRHGFETTFALGLLDDISELISIGVWRDDAQIISENLHRLRAKVAEWTPFLSRIPSSRISVAEFLLATPVPHLAAHVSALSSCGFDHVACIKVIKREDLDQLSSIPCGHKIALLHISMAMSGDCFSILPSIDIEVCVWLAHLAPPLHRYEGMLQLICESSFSVANLLTLEEGQIFSLPIKLGHKRVLWHYIYRERLHWKEILL